MAMERCDQNVAINFGDSGAHSSGITRHIQ